MKYILPFKCVIQNCLGRYFVKPKEHVQILSGQKNLVTVIKYNYRNFTMTSFPKFELLPSPIKSESDKKEYRVIKLQNELVACLISEKSDILETNELGLSNTESNFSYSSDDSGSGSGSEDEGSGSGESMDTSSESEERPPEQKMAAAALCVGVGSYSDPIEVPGMAHFLEHMVFMGSEKYPTENDFDSFIKKGGGSSNASTDAEMTTFYFECLEKHLSEALDKFSQFFISPLMKKSAMTREREAIDSEFRMALASDSSRKEQLLCTLAKLNSPVNSFGWGNLKTLKENISDDKLYEGVHEFRKRHYSAHRMTLAIQARLPLDTLQNLVIECFSSVPHNNLRKDDFSAFANGIFDTPEFNRIYYVKPVKELIKVDLTWSLPSLLDKYRSKPMNYVSYLLGDEGKGSLLSYLKKRMWAVSAQAGNEESGSEHNSMFALFNVSINLTEDGLRHLNDVIEAVFSYLNMVKKVGPQRRIYDEIKLISDTSFRFAAEETSVDKVENVCESMQLYPSEDYMAGSELYYEFDPKSISMIIDELIPNKLNVMVTTKNLPDGLKFEKVEKWFGTQYVDLAISQTMRTRWENVEPYPELNIPTLNPFLTDNFAILPRVPGNPEYPQKIINTEYCELWYRRDQKFNLPMATYYFYLVSADCTKSARHLVILDMFVSLLTFSIAEESYPATIANLVHSFGTLEKGVSVKIWGFNEKIPKLLELIANYIKNLDNYINEEMFNGVKETIQKYYYNRLLKPSALAKDIRLKLLVNSYFTPEDRYTDLVSLTYHDMIQFIKNYRSGLYLKACVQGNVVEEVAQSSVNDFINKLEYVPLPKDRYPMYMITQLPIGEKCMLVESFNKNDSNSITANYYQIGPFSLIDSTMTDVMMLIIEEPLFDVLRTKEQLGYHVYCAARDTYGVLGFSITVNTQADKFTTQHLDARINEFLKHTQQIMSDMKPEALEQIKEDLIKTKQVSDVHLREEVDRNWAEIVNDDYMFDRINQEIDSIRTITLEELKSWWNKHNHFGGKENFRKLSIQVVGHSLDKKRDSNSVELLVGSPLKLKVLGDNQDGENTDYFIKNIDHFKRKLPLYPGRPMK